jgi:hypothetical protein
MEVQPADMTAAGAFLASAAASAVTGRGRVPKNHPPVPVTIVNTAITTIRCRRDRAFCASAARRAAVSARRPA